jgi:hypothetical protein
MNEDEIRAVIQQAARHYAAAVASLEKYAPQIAKAQAEVQAILPRLEQSVAATDAVMRDVMGALGIQQPPNEQERPPS